MTKATHGLAMEMLAAIRKVGDRHKLHPSRPDDVGALLTAFGAVLIALIQIRDPTATGITVRQETRDGKRGTGVTVHHDETKR